MKEMGIESVLIVSGREHIGDFLKLLGSGVNFGLKINYEIQEKAGGIAQALSLAQDFVGREKMAVILGDNIFEDDLSSALNSFNKSSKKAHIFLKEVDHPQSYGVPRFENERIIEIIEKPIKAPSNFAVTGCYFYTPDVFSYIRKLSPSDRGELEISDVNDYYVQSGEITYSILNKFWGDCGESLDQLMEVSKYVRKSGL